MFKKWLAARARRKEVREQFAKLFKERALSSMSLQLDIHPYFGNEMVMVIQGRGGAYVEIRQATNERSTAPCRPQTWWTNPDSDRFREELVTLISKYTFDEIHQAFDDLSRERKSFKLDRFGRRHYTFQITPVGISAA